MNKAFALLALMAAARCLPAQVSLATVKSGVTTPAGAAVSFGAVAAGWDASDLVFNISYTGAASKYYLTYFSLQPGTPFSVVKSDWKPQSLPAVIPTGGLNFTVRFQPNQLAGFSATLSLGDQANPTTVLLLGTGTPGFTVTAGTQPLSLGQTISFGSVQVGSSQTVPLTLDNQTSATLVIGAIAAEGPFQIAGNSPAGASVPPGASATVQLTFTPTAAGPQQGTLTIGIHPFPLAGIALPPPPQIFPAPSIQITLAAPSSAQQGTVAVNLPAASSASGAGTLTLAFQSAVNAVADDPSINFADGTRTTTFTVAKGASAGEFASGPTLSFGTGTTAGSLTFTVTLGNQRAQSSVTIPVAAIGIDAAVAARDVACAPTILYCTATNVELQINGWDNTRTTSQITFTFFDSTGRPIAPGSITAAASASFAQYFAGSDLGGVFGLHALFPISGDANQVVAAQVQLTNTAGTAQTKTITF